MAQVVDLATYRARRRRAEALRRLTLGEARELLRLFAPVSDAEARRAARADEPDEILYSSVPWVRPEGG